MTPEEIRGRRVTIVIALLVGIPPLLVLLGFLATGKSIPWFQIILPIVLSVLLCLGYRWARAFTTFSLLAGSLLLFLGPLVASIRAGVATGNAVDAMSRFDADLHFLQAGLTLILSIPFAAVYITSAIILWRSKAVEAFFDRRTATRDTLPSLRDTGGV